ncbi:MAG TPA: HdeD family acid-resistance protein [Candidatus Binataceae bacterium]|jgi:uncharacterized membrane protein HdeD (DUF308 family)|nr:HdeD family acid-resistance protein [Candidatus Binataceae bacterium]
MGASIAEQMKPPSSLKWGWVLALGIAMIVLGTIALGDMLAVTLVSVLLIGWLLILAGVVHIVHLVRHQEERTFWHILTAVLDLVAGIYLVVHPGLGALSLTLVIAAFLLASGVARLVWTFASTLPHKAWRIIDALLSIVLGVLLLIHWPFTGVWFIGFAVAIGLIFRGWAWVMIALALRSRSTPMGLAPQPA